MYLFRSMISRRNHGRTRSGRQVGITSLSPASIDEHQRCYGKANAPAAPHRPRPRGAVTTEIIRRIFVVDATIQYADSGTPVLLPQTMRPLAASVIDNPSRAETQKPE